jgi:hypothetical protein
MNTDWRGFSFFSNPVSFNPKITDSPSPAADQPQRSTSVVRFFIPRLLASMVKIGSFRFSLIRFICVHLQSVFISGKVFPFRPSFCELLSIFTRYSIRQLCRRIKSSDAFLKARSTEDIMSSHQEKGENS